MTNRNNPGEDPVEGSRATIELDRPDKPSNLDGLDKKPPVEQDADGQYARTNKGHTNDGVASGDPRVLSGDDSGDATWPLEKERGDG